MPHDEIDVEVFRTGDYGARGRYEPEDLERIAGTYDPAVHEAPVTFDHEQKGPAHGWVKGLRRVGDRLVATIGRASGALMGALATGSYKKRSIELYRTFSTTGAPYLKAVSFLGAAAPAVKGLADPQFAAEGADEVLAFEESMPPVVPPPQLDAAREARQRLVAANVWRPEWEAHGLLAVFESLAGTEQFDALVHCFEAIAPPVPLGAMQATDPDAGALCFAEVPADASPESVARHRAALELQHRHPELDYRAALLAVR